MLFRCPVQIAVGSRAFGGRSAESSRPVEREAAQVLSRQVQAAELRAVCVEAHVLLAHAAPLHPLPLLQQLHTRTHRFSLEYEYCTALYCTMRNNQLEHESSLAA